VMRLIDAAEYQQRKASLHRCYDKQMPYSISCPPGWLSTVEEMLVMLELSLKPESFVKIRFLEISYRHSSPIFDYFSRDTIDKEDDERAFEIVNIYAQTASDKCQVCGLPGKQVVKDGHYSMLCIVHSDLC